MFSGIVECTGIIVDYSLHANDCLKTIIKPLMPFSDLKVGDSIAVNGVCLTLTAIDQETFSVTMVPETMRLTNLSDMTVNRLVNLERSLKMSDRIGGHCVQGHIDTIGEISELIHDGNDALILKITLPELLQKYIVNKGFITLDGMSITIIEAEQDYFTVTLIPHTRENTIAKHYKKGSKINIEVDMIGKYIEKMLKENYL